MAASHPHRPGRSRPLVGGRRRARRPAADDTGATAPAQLEATPLLAGLDGLPADSILHTFHPAVASWFRRRFPSGPTEPQRRAWPHIRSGNDVLVASPTGTGKTLTGFLVAIDAAYRAQVAGGDEAAARRSGPGVIYVSPLRALAVDVHENLQVPLAGIAEEAERLGTGRPGPHRRGANRRHAPVRTGGHAPVAARPAGHHARVPLPAPHGGVVADHAAECPHRRSSTRCTPWPVTSAVRTSPSVSSG